MATWGLHIRIAEAILSRNYLLDAESFLVGNIGPDCGMPNDDWSMFDPPTEVSHWSEKGKKNINAELFYDTYLTKDIICLKEKSFLIGYYVHLLTDIEFSKLYTYKRKHDRNYDPMDNDKNFIWEIKKDWYDLDHLYFKENPQSIFFSIFQNINEFPNYLPYYPEGAIFRQIKYITDYYQNPSENLDREYIYLSMEEMNKFAYETTALIENKLNNKLNLQIHD